MKQLSDFFTNPQVVWWMTALAYVVIPLVVIGAIRYFLSSRSRKKSVKKKVHVSAPDPHSGSSHDHEPESQGFSDDTRWERISVWIWLPIAIFYLIYLCRSWDGTRKLYFELTHARIEFYVLALVLLAIVIYATWRKKTKMHAWAVILLGIVIVYIPCDGAERYNMRMSTRDFKQQLYEPLSVTHDNTHMVSKDVLVVFGKVPSKMMYIGTSGFHSEDRDDYLCQVHYLSGRVDTSWHTGTYQLPEVADSIRFKSFTRVRDSVTVTIYPQ